MCPDLIGIMFTFSLSLPRHRFSHKFPKRRFSRTQKTAIRNLREKINVLSNIRQGSKLSRVFRHLFIQKRVKTVLGASLIFLFLISSLYSPSVSALSTIGQTDPSALPANIIELTTKVARRLPLDQLRITQRYSFFHSGIDFDGVTGDPVYPIMRGTVETVVTERWNLGKYIIVDHGSGLKSVYGHLSKFEVQVGQEVETNQVIGRVGATGRSFGDHLHLEVMENNHRINPALVIPLY